jgi:hypothetical protein
MMNTVAVYQLSLTPFWKKKIEIRNAEVFFYQFCI